MAEYDCIVLGAGGVGSAALAHAAKRGARVLAIDRFSPPHSLGSSHGATRIIRLAYFEHPDYVPMLRRAYELWETLSQATGQPLYEEVGLIEVGPPHGEVITGVTASAQQHGLAIETLTAADCQRRFPGFQIPADYRAVFEPRAGLLHVEACVAAHLQLAQQHGAQLNTGETVLNWQATNAQFQVCTDRATYTTDRLIVAGGTWANTLLGDLGIPLTVRRKSMYWYQNGAPEYHAASGCPGFLFELPHGVFYGFPQLDALSVKVAEHSGGHAVTDPLLVDRSEDHAETARIKTFMASHLPRVSSHCTRHEVCMYTMTPDSHFVVDRHPRHPGLAYAAGLSGHGFKFTAMLGEALVQLAFDGQSKTNIDFLSARRFSSIVY